MWHLRSHFEYLHHVPHSCSVVFRCVKALDLVETPLPSPDFFTLQMIHEAYEWSVGCATPDRHDYLKAAKLFFLLERQFYEPALVCAQELLDPSYTLPRDLLTGMRPVLTSYRRKAERAHMGEGQRRPAEFVQEIERLLDEILVSTLPATTGSP
jgi:hypothetical protein